MFQRQISKQGLSSVVDFNKGASISETVKFSLEDLKDLFTLRENTVCDTHDLLDCGCLAVSVSLFVELRGISLCKYRQYHVCSGSIFLEFYETKTL